jgi:hypothetical protein
VNTSSILDDLGYEIDTSVLTRTDLGDEEGPNFSRCGGDPYWFGTNRRLLEIPMTAGYVGGLRCAGPLLRKYLTSSPGMALHLPGIFSRLGLFERIVLTPEGITWEEHQRLTKTLYQAGQRFFSFTYHSPSLGIGYTPYVQSEQDLSGFLDKFERYFDFFFGELGGRAATPTEIQSLLTSEQPAHTADGVTPRVADGDLFHASERVTR